VVTTRMTFRTKSIAAICPGSASLSASLSMKNRERTSECKQALECGRTYAWQTRHGLKS
jgi:hypothetical protein